MVYLSATELRVMSPLYLLGIGALYGLSVIVYRLLFHPLAIRPGPFWARLTDCWSVYHCWIGDRHLEFYRLHRKYGDVVRIGPNRISVNSASALQRIYSASANTQKSKNYNAFHHLFKVPMVATIIDRKRHAFRRRIHSQALSVSALRELDDSLLANCCKFEKILDNGHEVGEWGSAMNMTKWFAYLGSDIIGDLTFSRNWGLLDGDDNRNIPDVISQGLGGLSLAGYMPMILSLRIDKILFRKLDKAKSQFHRLSNEQSAWRMQQNHLEKRDLFANLLESKDPQTGSGFTQEELIAEAGILIVAGGDTVATTMAATLFYCLHYPDALLRLYNEIRTTFTDLQDLRAGERLNSCRYLRACIDESMRLTPPVSALLPREIVAGGLDVDGQHYPAGTDIGVPHYALHHDERYYPSPFLFKPERWIPSPDPAKAKASAEAVALANSAFCGFSVGRAACVGKNLAYQEMMTVLARILWKYDVRLIGRMGEGRMALGLDRERQNESQTWEGFVSTHEGPMVEYKRRC